MAGHGAVMSCAYGLAQTVLELHAVAPGLEVQLSKALMHMIRPSPWPVLCWCSGIVDRHHDQGSQLHDHMFPPVLALG